ncbi:hypothetical protein ACFONG_20450 [Uliginosibacterium paludis]|uniref:Uncharacterized protein n=1 Tax=Uliginosibacterium paludis TaxID=1615952 RepID=A0ABV2CW34_9RHOO
MQIKSRPLRHILIGVSASVVANLCLVTALNVAFPTLPLAGFEALVAGNTATICACN